MRFKFTGTSEEVFPSIVTDNGTLACKPGDVVELDHDPQHPRLEATTGKGKALGGVIAAGWHGDVVDPPELVVPVNTDPQED